MRVTVDQGKCVGAGQCCVAAEQVFDQSDQDGGVILLNANPPAELHDDVRKAANQCPGLAITVIEE
jgi:ferredoxin